MNACDIALEEGVLSQLSKLLVQDKKPLTCTESPVLPSHLDAFSD